MKKTSSDAKHAASREFRRAAASDKVPEVFAPALAKLSEAAFDEIELPVWNLPNLYDGLDCPRLAADKEKAETLAAQFNGFYEGTIHWLDGEGLAAAIIEYEKIETLRQKMSAYLYLLESDDSANIAKTADMHKFLSDLSGKVTFLVGEINEIPERDLLIKIASPFLAPYAPWIGRMRADYKYLLTSELEGASHNLNTANGDAWKRAFNQMIAATFIEFDGKTMDMAEAERLVVQPSVDVETRRRLRHKVGEALQAQSIRAAHMYSAMIEDRLADDAFRGYPRPDASANIVNGVDSATADIMFDTVKGGYRTLSHRYYRWKARQHDLDVMDRAYVASSLPQAAAVADTFVPWDEARRVLLRALRRFSPKFARVAQKFFDEGYIDAQPRSGKEGGAFCVEVGPGGHPFILMNYTGQPDDIASSLGHEMGHGIHQVLAFKARGALLSEMPTAIAETASIFAEMLVFEEVLRAEKDMVARKALLAEKVEGILNNSLRQLSYHDFERRMHEERKSGPLDAERISDIWVETQRSYFGPSVALDLCDRYRWMTIPHLFDTPFYVQSYCFAQVMVCGLYQAYKQAEAEGKEARETFVANYIELLEAGITKNLYDMFSPFGLDPETPEFWQGGLALMSKFLDDLCDDAPPSQKQAAKPQKTEHKPNTRPPRKFGSKAA